jgi:hypothetical protein
MPSNRTFYRTVVTITILSEDPYEFASIDMINYDITEGACSGQIEVGDSIPCDGVEMADLLHFQASDPGFFRLDNEGNDLEEDNATQNQ